MNGVIAMTIIIIITIIKINWSINLDQKDQAQMPNTERSISGSICPQASLRGQVKQGNVASYLEKASKNFWNSLSSLPGQTQIPQATQ